MAKFNPLHHLHGKMTLTYAAVTGGVFLLLWFSTVWLIYIEEGASEETSRTQLALQTVVNDIVPYLQSSSTDTAGLQAYLDLWVSGDRLRIEDPDGDLQAVFNGLKFVAVTDTTGKLMAIEPQTIPVTQETLPLLPSVVADTYTDILMGNIEFQHITYTSKDEETYYTMIGLPEDLGGLIIVCSSNADVPSLRQELAMAIPAVSVSMLCGIGIMGTLFGWLASSGLVRRLRQLQGTVAVWEKGDLSPRIHDKSADEIGQLSRDLNQMAQQLDRLMTTQGELAALEERNRLARDLHDTVKQQIFAASMQLSSARTVIQDNPMTADQMLHEVEELIDRIQVDLNDLILALRPASLADRGLAAALQDYVDDWSQRTKVHVELVVQGERPIPLAIEQELYRVCQEALANIDKHAQAKRVTIKLKWQPQSLRLEIEDDGVGFDSQAPTIGFGLHSMNERLAALSGLVAVVSQPGQGARVIAQVELDT